MKSPAALLIVGLLSAFASAQEVLPPSTSGTGSHVHHPTGPGGLGDDDGSGGGGGEETVRCSGHPQGYPSGWTLKVLFNYNTGYNSICTAYLYDPSGNLDDVIGTGDCDMLCGNIH